jgi:hypothetical protein
MSVRIIPLCGFGKWATGLRIAFVAHNLPKRNIGSNPETLTMFARVMSTNLKKDLINEAAAEWRTHIEPFKGSGMERAYMLVDRATGKYLSITIWESEALQQANAISPGQVAGRSAMTEKYFEAAPTPGGYDIVAVIE